MKQAQSIRTDRRGVMNESYDEKQLAFNKKQQLWEQVQATRSYNGPLIEELNARQESAFQNMKEAFEQASAAYEAHDGASAKAYASKGHHFKAEMQAAVEERRRLIQQIRETKELFEIAKSSFESKRETYKADRDTYESAAANHQQQQALFDRARDEFHQAKQAFDSRLSSLKGKSHDSGVLFDQSVSTKSPLGAKGEYSLKNGEGGATQYYDDDHRVSWDLDEEGKRVGQHWTNQSVKKKHERRHDPPPHAR